jgi:hypothetical protein
MRFPPCWPFQPCSRHSPHWAQSVDVEGTITDVSTAELTISLNDGQVYQAPSEFNFEGLKSGVKVLVFYTEVNGKRMINDLELVE